jgi:hypothetical protein
MYTVEVTLRGTPLSLAVQRKELSDAETLYRTIADTMKTTAPSLLELTCEKETDKKIAVLVSEITAVQLSEKGGGPSKGGFTGFGV